MGILKIELTIILLRIWFDWLLLEGQGGVNML